MRSGEEALSHSSFHSVRARRGEKKKKEVKRVSSPQKRIAFLPFGFRPLSSRREQGQEKGARAFKEKGKKRGERGKKGLLFFLLSSHNGGGERGGGERGKEEV